MSTQEQHDAVAITGMGCRWPGGVRNTTDLWEFLKNRVDGWKEFDNPRYSTRGFHHPDTNRPGTMAMRGAYLLEEDARLFDHTFFNITALEVETMDPSQRKLLEVTYEAIENAGETLESVSSTRTGVFVGNFCLDHWVIQSRDWDNPRPYAFTGAGTSILANRVSYVFNLNGPSLTVDTACSSSMYALHLAMNAIRAGDCDSAIVASANWIADPSVTIALDKLGALSASGRSHTFDAKAEGYARGEGFVHDRGSSMNANGRTGGITRPSPAGQEAVIREAYRNAGNLPFGDTTYFECHGTGTYVGDPLEVAAVGNVFAKERSDGDPLLIGSTKTNVGHGEGASALASIMKVVLSLEHEAIPPIYDLQTLNPNIDFENAAVKVVEQLTPWPSGRLQRASINSFGYGGANAHCIIDHVHTLFPDYVKPGVYAKSTADDSHTHVPSKGVKTSPGDSNDEYDAAQSGQNSATSSSAASSINGVDPADKPVETWTRKHRPVKKSLRTTRASDAGTRQLVLLPFAAHNKDSLNLNIDSLRNVVDRFQLADVAYTLASKRSKLPQRTFRIVDKDYPADALTVAGTVLRSPLQTSKVGFVFTGQGAQWPAMGSQLFEYRTFQATVSYLDYVLASLPNCPNWSLHDILSGKTHPELIQEAEISQTVCTALQVGLVDLLSSWSVRPNAVAGHSSGEIAAAYASGRITAAEAIIAAYFRGQAVARNQQEGSMLAVGLGHEQIAPYLIRQEKKTRIAAYNSPGSVTISGDKDAIYDLSKLLEQKEVFNRMLKTGGNAYHSHHMLPLGVGYDAKLSAGLAHIKKLGLAEATQRYPVIPWMSSVTPDVLQPETGFAGPKYWRANLESPVRFTEALKNLVHSDDIQVVVEIGPHPALKSPIEQILKALDKTSISYRSALKRSQDGREGVLSLAGALFCLNTEIDLVAVNAVDSTGGLKHGSIAIDLPPYQYEYGPVIYHESRRSKEYRHRKDIRHDLLGSRIVGNAKLRPQWRNILRLKDVPWLSDHRLLPDAVFPAAGYIAIIVEAASRIHRESHPNVEASGYSLSDISINSSLDIPDDDYGIEIVTSMEISENTAAQSSSWATISISSVARDTDTWTQHCTGRVKSELVHSNSTTASLSIDIKAERIIDAGSWYKKFTTIGLGYGPTFQSLSSIRAAPGLSNQCSATLSLKTTAGTMMQESPYILHPASLDGAIQLALIACHNGQVDEASNAYVPVRLPHLYLSASIPLDLDSAIVVAKGERRGVRSAYLDFSLFSPEGREVLKVENLRATSYLHASQSLDKAFSSPLTTLRWKPDIRALNNDQIRHLSPPPPENVDRAPLWAVVNELAYAIVYSIYEQFAGESAIEAEPKPSGEVGHFFEWIKRRGTLDDNYIRHEFKTMSQNERLERIDALVSRAPHVPEVQTSKLLHDHMGDILTEKRTGIDVIISKGLLTPLYEKGLLMTGIYPQLFKVIDMLGHANPNLRYIEIGGGTGGATRVAMKALRGPNGIKSYGDYTFTDISPGFLNTAREALSDSGFDDMIYNVLDAEQDPIENGYESVYDVVIACQVLHATSNMHKTLKNVGKLLKPGGKLVLVETTQNFMVPGVVVGTFTGYWAGIPDGRVDAPFMSLEAWDTNLKAVGFTGTELVLDDFPRPQNTTSIIVSTYNGSGVAAKKATAGGIQLFHSANKAPELCFQLSQRFGKSEIISDVHRLHDATKCVSPGSRVVVFLDDAHVCLDRDEEDLVAFQYLAKNTSSLTVMTSCGIARGRNPDGSLIPGMLRVLKTENPAGQFLSIDIDANDFQIEEDEKPTSNLVQSLVDQVLSLDKQIDADDNTPLDREFVWQNGAMWVSRYATIHENEVYVPTAYRSPNGSDLANRTESLPIEAQGSVVAAFETPGVIGSLYFTADTNMWKPVPSDHIDIKTVAIGLDHDDLDVWSGRVDTVHDLIEYSGIVTAVGHSVRGFHIGDRVYGLCGGKFRIGNYARVAANLALKLQPQDDTLQMTTLPKAYLPVIYALEHTVSIEAGTWASKAVLVQNASSTIGLAAILLALAKGANVFALVHTREDAAVLNSRTNLKPCNILSPTASVTGVISRDRFDIILTIGRRAESLAEAPELLAPMGHLIYIGSMEEQSSQDFSMPNIKVLLQKNANFSSIDLPALFAMSPALVGQLLRRVDKLYREGRIHPARLFRDRVADVGTLQEVLPNFAKSDGRSGKLLLSFGKPTSVVKMTPPVPTVRFDPEAIYLITGGLGGLGQSILNWMVARGARHLVILSRRSIDMIPGAQRLVEGNASLGVDISAVVCDVTDLPALQAVVKKISAVRPLRGVLHAAVSWRDLSFDKLTLDRWQESLAAKVHGTKNLHEVTLSMPLDFFIMTTSLLSVYALATQAAYTAANNFQDTFARYRRAQGLPASTISFSLIRDVGPTGSDTNTLDTFERNRTVTLTEKQFLALFESVFFSPSSKVDMATDALHYANLTTCLDPARMLEKETEAGGLIPRWYSDGRVAIIMRALIDAQQHALNQNSPDATGSGKSGVARLQHSLAAGISAGSAERSATVSLVETAIIEVVAGMLFIDLEAVDPSRSIADYGVDSLIAAELRNWFLDALKTDISMLKLLDQTVSMSVLAAKIVDEKLAGATPA